MNHNSYEIYLTLIFFFNFYMFELLSKYKNRQSINIHANLPQIEILLQYVSNRD